jgi:hypothetical protein
MKTWVHALLLLIILQAAYAGCVSASADAPNVLLVSFDGYQPAHMWEQLEAGELPNLKRLMDGGVYLELSQIDYRTQTKVAHAQMLSGYQSALTGVYSNGHVFHALPTGYTFLERAEEHIGGDNIATGFISGKRTNIAPVFSRMEGLDYVSIHHEYLENVTGGTGEKFLAFIDEHHGERFAAFFHTTEPDKLGHLHGENSPEYSEGGEACDRYLGLILDSLERYGILNMTLIYVTTDHGFAEGGFNHLQEPRTWLITNDQRLKANQGDARLLLPDIAATVMYSLGIPLKDLGLQGYPLQEPLPPDADGRLEVMGDAQPPKIVLDEDNDLNKQFEDRGPLTVRWRLDDERELSRTYVTLREAGLKYVNGSCGNLVYESSEINGSTASFEATFTVPRYEESVYEVSIYGVDERENIAVQTIILSSDRNPPQIDVINVEEIQRVSGSLLSLECNFTDPTGITAVEAYFDGDLLVFDRCSKTRVKTLVRTFDLSGYERGNHVITLKAVDVAGNVASRDVDFTMEDNGRLLYIITNVIGLILGILSFGVLYRLK